MPKSKESKEPEEEPEEENEDKPIWFDLRNPKNKKEPRSIRAMLSGKKYWGDKDFKEEEPKSDS